MQKTIPSSPHSLFQSESKNSKLMKTDILYFPIPHNALCLPPQILHKLLLRNALWNMQTSQEYFTTIVYAKFGGTTECIMGNWKVVNSSQRLLKFINSSCGERQKRQKKPLS